MLEITRFVYETSFFEVDLPFLFFFNLKVDDKICVVADLHSHIDLFQHLHYTNIVRFGFGVKPLVFLFECFEFFIIFKAFLDAFPDVDLFHV